MSKLKIFQLKSSIFERPCDVTWWEKPVFRGEKPVFQGARALDQKPGIANLEESIRHFKLFYHKDTFINLSSLSNNFSC